MDDSQRETVLAANEAVHRRVNEAIERGRWPGEDRAIAFRCECARNGCTSMIELTREQYERVREHPRRFVLLPGHQDPEVEDVIAERPGHVVVEKRDRAGVLAEASDPRS